MRDTPETINLIVQRGLRLAKDCEAELSDASIRLPILMAHHGDYPLDLDALLDADNSNFAHDVFGLNRHTSPKTGKVEDCFVPRFAR